MLVRTALVAALALSFVPAAGTRIRLEPAEGLALRKTFDSTTESALESMSVVVGGQEQDQEQTQETVRTTRLVVVDRYVAVGDGRVTKLERSFDEIATGSEGEMSFGDMEHSMSSTGTSELEGHAVTFTWDEDAEEYVAGSEDEDVESDWLEGLAFDLDFLAVLPDGEVEVGDEWEVDAEGLRALLRFDNGLPMDTEQSVDGEVRETPEELEDEEDPDESVTGDITARLEAVREEDGARLAVIALSGEYEATTTGETTMDGEHGTQTTISESVATVELEAELLWDLAGGHLRSCTLEAELTTTGSAEITMEFGEQTMEFSHESAHAGELRFTAEFEPAE